MPVMEGRRREVNRLLVRLSCLCPAVEGTDCPLCGEDTDGRCPISVPPIKEMS